MITVTEALEIILNEVSPLGVESVHINDSLGRILADDIRAVRPNPPWDNSAMDGYALRSDDVKAATKENPIKLTVIYDLPAGSVPGEAIALGQAVRIMTGAPVPKGADCVVMVEKTAANSKDSTEILTQARPGENIRRAGEDFKAGDIVIVKGTLIRPAEIAMLATIGVAHIFVHKRPRVAVLSTGDELVEIDEAPGSGKILNSNGYALSALAQECGAIVSRMGIARDTKESLKEKLTSAMHADCIISSGGVSVGDYDFVKDVLDEMGSRMVFWKVAMKPGKPLAFGVIGGKPAFGLPGNPISSMVAFEQFVRPALLKMSGAGPVKRAHISAIITKDLKIKSGRMNFIRAVLKISPEGNTVTPLEGQGSGMIAAMVKANCFIVVPADSTGYKDGQVVPVQPFDSSVLNR